MVCSWPALLEAAAEAVGWLVQCLRAMRACHVVPAVDQVSAFANSSVRPMYTSMTLGAPALLSFRLRNYVECAVVHTFRSFYSVHAVFLSALRACMKNVYDNCLHVNV